MATTRWGEGFRLAASFAFAVSIQVFRKLEFKLGFDSSENRGSNFHFKNPLAKYFSNYLHGAVYYMQKGLAFMMNPLMYDFRSLIDPEAAKTQTSTEDLNLEALINERMADACRLFTTELFDGFYNVGRVKMKIGLKRMTLQKFRTPGIDARLFVYKDEGKDLLCYFICRKGETDFKVMRMERIGAKAGISTDLYGKSGLATHNPADLAYLRTVTDSLADGIKATFDSVFAT